MPIGRLPLVAALLVLAACQPLPPPSAPGPMPAPAPSPLPPPDPAALPLATALDSIFADTAFAHAFWGVEVRSGRTEEILYRRNAERVFVPASNMKIVTGAAALEALGPEYRYRTRVEAAGPVEDSVLRGGLVVRGSGDPSISARFGDPRAVFRVWADSLRAHGVTRVEGSLIGDDDVFDDLVLGPGWSWDDVESYYAAEIGGLELNEGVVDVRVSPGRREGSAAVVALSPRTAYVPVENRVVTGAAGSPLRVEVSRAPTGPGAVLTGSIPADTSGVTETLAIRDNTLFFLTVLRETLQEAGIHVEGGVVDADVLPGGAATLETTHLFAYASPPLREILPAFLKPSQNQLGEILLKTLGRELRGQGSARAGAAAIDSLLQARGLDTRLLRQADGSGLSRYNLVAPTLLISVLEMMAEGPHRELWYASLPVAGVDGTLARRLRNTPLQGRLRAKTGTLSGVRSLSGYLSNAAGEPILFSIMVNHHLRSAAGADRVIDAAVQRISESR